MAIAQEALNSLPNRVDGADPALLDETNPTRYTSTWWGTVALLARLVREQAQELEKTAAEELEWLEGYLKQTRETVELDNWRYGGRYELRTPNLCSTADTLRKTIMHFRLAVEREEG